VIFCGLSINFVSPKPKKVLNEIKHMRENMGNENKRIRRIRCTYIGFFSKNSSPNKILKIIALENTRIRRKQAMNTNVLENTAKDIHIT
jgi:hypothetical protein